MSDNGFEEWYKTYELRCPAIRYECKAAYAAGLEAKWQSIETAPKDESVILLGLPKVGALKEEGSRRVYEGRWSSVQDKFTSVNGFIDLAIANYWMPLPEPPLSERR